MEREKSAEAMWKQIFQIEKYHLVNWKLKWNINPRWEISNICIFNFGDLRMGVANFFEKISTPPPLIRDLRVVKSI